MYALEEKYFDAECPICTLLYSNDNPPIVMPACSGHPDWPYIICRNDVKAFYLRHGGATGKDTVNTKDLSISCPVCFNEMRIECVGKTMEQVMKALPINTEMLNKMYMDIDIVERIKADEEILYRFNYSKTH